MGQFSVADRNTAGQLASGQTIITVTGSETLPGSTASTYPLFVVPAGKTFFLTDVTLTSTTATEADIIIQYSLTADSTSVVIPIFQAAVLSTLETNCQGIESQASAPAGSVVEIVLPVTSGGKAVIFNIAGYLDA